MENEDKKQTTETKERAAECYACVKMCESDIAFATRRTLFGVVAFIACILAGTAGVIGLLLLLVALIGYCSDDYRLILLAMPGLISLGVALVLLLYAALLSPADSLLKVLRLSVTKEKIQK